MQASDGRQSDLPNPSLDSGHLDRGKASGVRQIFLRPVTKTSRTNPVKPGRLAGGPLFTKEELQQAIWGGKGATRTLDSHVSRARVKLRKPGAEGFILNCWRVGYKLCEEMAIKP